ncbi:hypothetical protein Tco_1475799 [Tanacetum coccineum]
MVKGVGEVLGREGALGGIGTHARPKELVSRAGGLGGNNMVGGGEEELGGGKGKAKHVREKGSSGGVLMSSRTGLMRGTVGGSVATARARKRSAGGDSGRKSGGRERSGSPGYGGGKYGDVGEFVRGDDVVGVGWANEGVGGSDRLRVGGRE